MSDLSEHFSSHLQELRQRVLFCAVTLAAASALAYFFSRPIAEFFMAPLLTAYPDLAGLVYLNLTEALFSYIKISILVGIIASFPVFLYHAWMYVAPGLHKSEKKLAVTVVFFATFLFGGGVIFAYLVVLPELLAFFMGFASEQLRPMPKFGAYLTFVARTSLAFGLSFEIPFLMVVAGKTGLVSKGYFVEKRVYFYLVILGLSFLLAMGDPLSTILLTVPLCVLYELGSLINRFL